MTIHDEGNDADVGGALRRAVGDEPPLTLNAGMIARQGAGRLRRRRATAVGGSILAVAALTAGVALGVPKLADNVVGTAASSSVPGCATVLRTDDPAVKAWQNGSSATSPHPPSSIDTGATSSSSVAEATSSSTTSAAAAGLTNVYGQPVLEWYTATKAASMATAFATAIPTEVHLSTPDASAQAGPLPFAAGSGIAGGGVIVSMGSARAFLTVDVQMWGKGAPPCTANLAHRYTSADGTITDVIDDPGSSASGHYMLAESFRPDGTLVDVGLNNSGGIVRPTTTLPLSVQQIAAIAALPELAITAY